MQKEAFLSLNPGPWGIFFLFVLTEPRKSWLLSSFKSMDASLLPSFHYFELSRRGNQHFLFRVDVTGAPASQSKMLLWFFQCLAERWECMVILCTEAPLCSACYVSVHFPLFLLVCFNSFLMLHVYLSGHRLLFASLTPLFFLFNNADQELSLSLALGRNLKAFLFGV